MTFPYLFWGNHQKIRNGGVHALSCGYPQIIQVRDHLSIETGFGDPPFCQWEIQDPKMEVLYHIRPYFLGMFPYIGLTLGLIYGRYLQFRILKIPLILGNLHVDVDLAWSNEKTWWLGHRCSPSMPTTKVSWQTRALNCAEQIENGTCKSNEVVETILKIP